MIVVRPQEQSLGCRKFLSRRSSLTNVELLRVENAQQRVRARARQRKRRIVFDRIPTFRTVWPAEKYSRVDRSSSGDRQKLIWTEIDSGIDICFELVDRRRRPLSHKSSVDFRVKQEIGRTLAAVLDQVRCSQVL